MMPASALDGFPAADEAGAWRLISSILLQEGAENSARSAEQIVLASQVLSLPSAVVAQLKSATTEAIEQMPDYCSASDLLVVRLYVRETKHSGAHRPPATRVARQRSEEGWGFFLVQKCAADDPSATGICAAIVELFLYQEP